jgi:hypothetical protein
MLILAMAALLLGAVLGLRFRVLILLPAAVVAIATMVAADSIEHSSLWTIVVDVVLALATQSQAPWQESGSSISKSTIP